MDLKTKERFIQLKITSIVEDFNDYFNESGDTSFQMALDHLKLICDDMKQEYTAIENLMDKGYSVKEIKEEMVRKEIGRWQNGR